MTLCGRSILMSEIDWKATLLKVHTDYVKNQGKNDRVTTNKNLRKSKKGPATKSKINKKFADR